MRFNAHSLFVCGLFAYNIYDHVMILGLFSACNGFIDTFRVVP